MGEVGTEGESSTPPWPPPRHLWTIILTNDLDLQGGVPGTVIRTGGSSNKPEPHEREGEIGLCSVAGAGKCLPGFS